MDTIPVQDESLFYCDVAVTDATNGFIQFLKEYSTQKSKQVYILKKVLGVSKELHYELSDIAIILMPKHPILILNYGVPNSDALEDYRLDLIEDLGHLSDKYGYHKILGRARKWSMEWFSVKNLDDFDVQNYIFHEVDHENYRKIDLLISLLIGSINSIEKIGLLEPETLLEQVKHKIVLFDGQQSRFIYQSSNQNSVRIQGMAGTGKTELLLHKLKDVYSTEKDSVIAFTCFNKVLANDMRRRIPEFFNFLKVDEQIDWENRLFVFSSWGSRNEPRSGLYRYVCHKYCLPFSTYRENNDFNALCRECLEALEQQENFDPVFDYMFIDESQDFRDCFFDLCKKITKQTVYIAGDIFQNIFDTTISTYIEPDYLLNKCYRTDPKTLMFAHAVGMGLYETPQLNWLDDVGWRSCGYTFTQNQTDQTVTLSRKPLRRFEDLEAINTIRLTSCKADSYSDGILAAVQNIREENPSVEADDIAIIILGDYRTLCTVADQTSFALYDNYGWETSKGYETKSKSSGKVYISNINNIKGLEFPFVICLVPNKISSNIRDRNAIYMTLTRSFLTSYFLVSEENQTFIQTYNDAIQEITDKGYMRVHNPSDDERREMATKVKISLASRKKTTQQVLEDFLSTEYPKLEPDTRAFTIETIENMLKIGKKFSEDQIILYARRFIEKFLEANIL